MGMRDDKGQNVSSRAHESYSASQADTHITPLLIVSPTSPICKPSYLPTAVTRPCSRRSTPDITCSPGLCPNGRNDPAHGDDNTPVHRPTNSRCAALRRSRIPVRSARKANDTCLGSDMTSHVGRSQSLSKLTDEDPAEQPGRSQQLSRPAASSPSTTPRKPKFQQHCRGQYSSSPCRSTCQASSPRPPPPHRHSFSGTLPVYRDSRHSPCIAGHEVYQMPQYFTWHLTLRSPSNSPLGSNRKTSGRNSVDGRYPSTSGESCDSDGQEGGTSGGEGNPDKEQDDEFVIAETWQSCGDEERPRYGGRGSSGTPERKGTIKGDRANVQSPLDKEILVASRHCNISGIVDYLNTMMQDSEQEDTESYCSDYGSGLATSPPGRLSDTDSTIEASAVSIDLPLKSYPAPTISYSVRKKPNLKALRWRSCQELIKPQETKSILKRQLSEQSLKSLEEELTLPGRSVEVYDGNLGVSLVMLSRYKHNLSSSITNSHISRRVSKEEINGRTSETRSSGNVRINGVSAREKHITRLESGDSKESMDFSCHDSMRVETSNSVYGEFIEIDDYMLPPLASSKQTFSAPLETHSNQQTRSGSKHRRSVAFKSNGSSCNKEKSILAKQYRKDRNISSTKKPYKDDLKLLIKMEKMSQLRDFDVDQILDIQNDDGSGPGLSEDEHQAEGASSTEGSQRTAHGAGVASPRKLLWYRQKDACRRSSERPARRLNPALSDAGRTANKAVLIAPPEYRHHSSGREQPVRQVSVSDTSQPSSARSHPSRIYSETMPGDSSTEDSDTGIELSELERCVLTLTHRRNQLRKQDTNAFLIAPPEYKISGDFTPY
ncbi:uncharacterized protein [Panulirus ornatus]|uniref:uncharacterized protein isoform X2 n=1 Tax=Panulirus ornatus TaxID=150431 RepID=UPI003A885040